MKVLQLAALFGGAVSAVNPLVLHQEDRRELAATTTVVAFVTEVNTFTTICTAAPDCPAGSTVYLTKTTVVDSTTTICSTAGHSQPPPFGASATPIISSSALPLDPGSSSAYPGRPEGSSGTPAPSPATSGVIRPSLPGFSVSVIPGPTLESSISIVSSTGSATPSSAPAVSGPTSGKPLSSVTATDPALVSASSSVSPAPSTPWNTNTDGINVSQPTGSSSGPYNGPSSSPGVPTNTNTDAVPTSRVSSPAGPSSPAATPSSANASSSGKYPTTLLTPSRYPTGEPSLSGGATPSRGSSPAHGPSSPSNSGSSAAPSSSHSGTYPTVGSATSDGYGPPTPPAESETTVDSTVSVTSYLTQTLTSIVTTPPSSTVPHNISTKSNTEATDISRVSSVSAYPSGSGWAHPTGNGSVISPRPTYSEVPINMGHVVGAGKSSLAAIVVALAFAHFA